MPDQYLAPTHYFDFEAPAFSEFAEKHADRSSEKQLAISLYMAVRDGFEYVPFDIRLKKEELRCSLLFNRDYGHCIDKATFLISCYRQAGLPARLGLAKVRNHVGTEKLEKLLGTNILVPHGYVEVLLEGKWVKCTPAFDLKFCEKLGVAPLDFDGEKDSIFQAYDREGADFMEYMEDYGVFGDVPLDLIITLMREYYPRFFDGTGIVRWEV
jgi:transglutaminase-like putative cysteine protease